MHMDNRAAPRGYYTILYNKLTWVKTHAAHNRAEMSFDMHLRKTEKFTTRQNTSLNGICFKTLSFACALINSIDKVCNLCPSSTEIMTPVRYGWLKLGPFEINLTIVMEFHLCGFFFKQTGGYLRPEKYFIQGCKSRWKCLANPMQACDPAVHNHCALLKK